MQADAVDYASLMAHLPDLIQDLAIILLTAGIITVIFRKLKQPVVLGYILAGILVGPHLGTSPAVTQRDSIQIWAEIGVIFLLFSLGLEFSFKKLLKVGGPASVTGIVELSAMFTIGLLTGKALGWDKINSIFLASIMAISSTTIIIRAFDEAAVKGRSFVQLVMGVLIIEDLAAVVLLVFLSTVAIRREFPETTPLLWLALKLVFFLALWFLSGIFFLPSLFRKLKSHLNQETLLVFSLGLCLTMVIVAVNSGFSPALGAFVMGATLGETSESERIFELTKPVRDLFAAIFFVSVGMLINPQLILQYGWLILLVSAVIVVGKCASMLMGSILSGQPLRRSVQAALSMGQIGEFSFIIAGLGRELHAIGDHLYAIAVGVSAVTSFSTLYLIRHADRIARYVDLRVPEKWKARLNLYQVRSQTHPSQQESRQLRRQFATRIIVNSVVVITIFLTARNYLSVMLGQPFSLVFAVVASTPFLWGITVYRPRVFRRSLSNIRGQWAAVEISRYFFSAIIVSVLAARFDLVNGSIPIALGLCATLLFFLSRRLYYAYVWFERNLISNFLGLHKGLVNSPSIPLSSPMASWESHITRLEVHPHSEAAGKTLEQLAVRERFGVTIVLIERGNRRMTAPDRHVMLFPHDRIYVIGTDQQIQDFQKVTEMEIAPATTDGTAADYSLRQILIMKGSRYAHKTIRDSHLREDTQGLVVGIDRSGERILNPQSTEEIRENDVLWVVGETNRMRDL